MTQQKSSSLLVTTAGWISPFLDLPVSKGRLEPVDIYALGDAPLHEYKALLLPMHCDQRYLLKIGSHLEAFLGRGGIVVVSGHVAYPFLPELQTYVAPPYRNMYDLFVYRAADHPIWAGVDEKDLTFRKGVAGFYGRGYNPPPPGAVVYNTLGPDRLPLDYIYTRPGGGTVLVHAGIDLWTFATFPTAQTSAARMPGQLLDWIDSITPKCM